jgi:hypothetical protein
MGRQDLLQGELYLLRVLELHKQNLLAGLALQMTGPGYNETTYGTVAEFKNRSHFWQVSTYTYV